MKSLSARTFRYTSLVLIVLLSRSAFPQTPPPPPNGDTDVEKTPQFTWSIEDVKRIALEQNPDLKSARANYEAASKAVGIAVSEYLPHVDVNAAFEDTTLPSPSAGSTPLLGTAEPYANGVISIHQTLFDFGKGLNQIEAGSANSKSAEQDALAVRNIVVLNVLKAFFNVAGSKKLVEVARTSNEQFKETLRRTAALVRTGVRPPFDLSQANVEASKAELEIVRAEDTYDLAKIALLNIMGMDKNVAFALIDPKTEDAVKAKDLNLDVLTDLAMSHRPEMKREDFAVAAAKYKMHAEIRDYFPKFELQGWYGQYLPEYPTTLRNAWGGGIGMSWHVFEGLKTSSRVGELGARLDQRQAMFEKQKQNIVAEVTASYLSLLRSEKNLEIANNVLNYALENVDLAKKRYAANVSTILELLVAQTALVNGEAAAIAARYKHEIALATLARTVDAPLTTK